MMQNLFGDQSEDEDEEDDEAVEVVDEDDHPHQQQQRLHEADEEEEDDEEDDGHGRSGYHSEEGEGESENGGEGDAEGEGESEGQVGMEEESEAEAHHADLDQVESDGEKVQSSPERELSDRMMQTDARGMDSEDEAYEQRAVVSRRRGVVASESEGSEDNYYADQAHEDEETRKPSLPMEEERDHEVVRDVFGDSDEDEPAPYRAQHEIDEDSHRSPMEDEGHYEKDLHPDDVVADEDMPYESDENRELKPKEKPVGPPLNLVVPLKQPPAQPDRFVNDLHALISPPVKGTPLPLILLGKSKNALLSIFLFLDQIVWAGRTGIYKNKERAEFLGRIALYCFLGSNTCTTIIELAELHRLSKSMKKLEKELKHQELYKNEQYRMKLQKSNWRLLALIKSSLDIVVAVGLLQLAPKKITPRVTGAFGFASSLIACYQVQLIRIECRVPEYRSTTQKVFHFLNFIVNGVRSIVFVLRRNVQLVHPEIFQHVLIDLPGLAFFATYALLVLFWAEIYYPARAMSTDGLRPAFYAINGVVYAIQIVLWLVLWWKPVRAMVILSKMFFAATSLFAASAFLLYRGRWRA